MLISIEHVAEGVTLGLWQIEKDNALSVRENERRAVAELLKVMTGKGTVINHEPSGKPFIDGCNISISHTHGYAAVMLSEKHTVGVDIEYMSDRVDRIASRFMRPDETYTDTVSRLVVWCAKEAIYKLYSEDDLTYQEMRVCMQGEGCAVVENLKRNIPSIVSYRTTPEFVLVYSYK